MKTLQKLKTFSDYAEFMYYAMEKKTRNDGTEFYCVKDEFRNFKDEKEKFKWIQDVCWTGHFNGNYLPSDSCYRFIHDALADISECETVEEAEERGHDVEADVYNSDLLKWASENLYNAEYVDKAVTEYGYDGFYKALQYGQVMFKREIYFAVLNELVEVAEE